MVRKSKFLQLGRQPAKHLISKMHTVDFVGKDTPGVGEYDPYK